VTSEDPPVIRDRADEKGNGRSGTEQGRLIEVLLTSIELGEPDAEGQRKEEPKEYLNAQTRNSEFLQ
jgi:hypothetical protein